MRISFLFLPLIFLFSCSTPEEPLFPCMEDWEVSDGEIKYFRTNSYKYLDSTIQFYARDFDRFYALEFNNTSGCDYRCNDNSFKRIEIIQLGVKSDSTYLSYFEYSFGCTSYSRVFIAQVDPYFETLIQEQINNTDISCHPRREPHLLKDSTGRSYEPGSFFIGMKSGNKWKTFGITRDEVGSDEIELLFTNLLENLPINKSADLVVEKVRWGSMDSTNIEVRFMLEPFYHIDTFWIENINCTFDFTFDNSIDYIKFVRINTSKEINNRPPKRLTGDLKSISKSGRLESYYFSVNLYHDFNQDFLTDSLSSLYFY